MTARAAARVSDVIAQQRAAIVRGEYPDPGAIERIAPILARLTDGELAPISKALQRNMELLVIAREAVLEMRVPAQAPVLRTYTSDGGVRPISAARATLLKR